MQSYYGLSSSSPAIFTHSDSIVLRAKWCSPFPQVWQPPSERCHEGGIFTTRKLSRSSADAQAAGIAKPRAAFSLARSRSHAHGVHKGRDDGRFYFLDGRARRRANIAEVVEAATGINLWAEWARIEIERGKCDYELPPHRDDCAGILISLARQEFPDTSAYNDAEVVWRLSKPYHAGLIVASKDPKRVEQLLDEYSRRFYEDFHTSAPLPERPTS